MTPTTVTALIFIAAGLLIMALSVPMMRRRIAPNPLYGLRVRATFADEWVWYEANARSGRDLLLVGVGICILAVVLPMIPGVTERSYPGILSVIVLVAVVVTAVIDIRYANRLLAERLASGVELKPRNPLRRGPIKSMRGP